MASSFSQPPIRLWKYRTWDEHGHTRALIIDGDIYFAPAASLNDPFEFRWRERLPTDPTEIDTYVRELCAKVWPRDSVPQRKVRYRRLIAELQHFASARKGGVGPTVSSVPLGVLCLSAVNDNILMWSHYAKNHTGVCVGLRTDRMRPKNLLAVNYQQKVPLLDAWAYINNREEAHRFVELARTKSAAWSYEQEWRTVDKIGVRRFPGCVDQVIIGALAPPETCATVREAVAAASHDIQIFVAKLSDTHYRLDISPEKPLQTVRTRVRRKRRVQLPANTTDSKSTDAAGSGTAAV